MTDDQWLLKVLQVFLLVDNEALRRLRIARESKASVEDPPDPDASPVQAVYRELMGWGKP